MGVQAEKDAARKYSLILVEDEPLYLDLLRFALSSDPAFEIAGAFRRGEECLGRAPELDPDVALLDIELGDGMNGIELGIRLREIRPHLGIVLLSNHCDLSFAHALRQGKLTGWSYLLKKSVSDLDALRRSISGAAEGRIVLDEGLIKLAEPHPSSQLARLTPRQREIIELIAQGYSNASIAKRLVVSPKTVENHINAIYEELNIGHDAAYHPRVLAVLTYLDQSSPKSYPISV